MADRPVGMTLSRYINLAGYEAQDVAAHLGIDKSAISAWSSKRAAIPLVRLQGIADFIHKDVEELKPLVRLSSGKRGRPWDKALPA